MIRSSRVLCSDDVTIECRVRRSPHAANPQFGESECMSCTMRSWAAAHPTDNTTDGPELVLQVVSTSPNASGSMHFSERFQSFGSAGGNRSKRRVYDFVDSSTNNAKKDSKPRSIPVADVIVVDTHTVPADPTAGSRTNYVLYLTTISQGYWEFAFSQQNAHDCLVAFLAASLPAERIVVVQQPLSEPTTTTTKTSITEGCSFDLDAFQADRIQERVQSETFSEKMQRKMARFAMVFEEMSTAISECACNGCGTPGMNASHSPAVSGPQPLDERRDSPPRPNLPTDYLSGMEFSQSNMDSSSVSVVSQAQTQVMPKQQKQPGSMETNNNQNASTRMEVEPELESTL